MTDDWSSNHGREGRLQHHEEMYIHREKIREEQQEKCLRKLGILIACSWCIFTLISYFIGN